jgi:hypothetical protein
MWSTEQIRLSVFFREPYLPGDKDWTLLTGQPESETRTNTPGGKTLSGGFGGGTLSVASQGKRVDLLLAPVASAAETPQAKLPCIGEWEVVRRTFIGATNKWLTTLEAPLVRMAFGGVLLWETSDNEKSYERLKELVQSVAIEPGRMQELLYRVNWPQTSSVDSALKLNRITNWNAMRYSIGFFQVGGGGQFETTPTREAFAVRFEFDHNTDQTRSDPIAKEKIQPIFEELVQMACDNATRGERP